MICINILVQRCDDGNNGGCGAKLCIQEKLGVNCTCQAYDVSKKIIPLLEVQEF